MYRTAANFYFDNIPEDICSDSAMDSIGRTGYNSNSSAVLRSFSFATERLGAIAHNTCTTLDISIARAHRCTPTAGTVASQ